MTSIGDKLALQLPLTSVTQSLEQIVGDAAINAAKAIGSSNAPPSADDTSLLPSAGIAAHQTAPPGDQPVAPASDFAPSFGPADAFIGMRAPATDAQTLSLGVVMQLARMLSPDSADIGSAGLGQPATTEVGPATTDDSRAAQPGTIAPETGAALATSPTATATPSSLDQKPAAIADALRAGSGDDGLPLPETTGGVQPGATGQQTPAAAPEVATTVDARLDGSLLATKIINERPDAPQMISAGVTSNALASALSESAARSEPFTEASDQSRPTEAADIASWQVGHSGTAASYAAIDVGAKQSSAWSDARDQSQQAARPPEEATRPAAETNGLDAPRPEQSITTGALIGAVLSAPEPDTIRAELMSPPADLLTDAAADTRTGITASGILNAAMIPGWPNPTLAGKSRSENPLAQQAAMRGMSDEEMLAYLTNLGADEATLAKVKKALEKPVVGRKIAFFLASLATALSVVLKSLGSELETIIEEDAEAAELRKQADARGRKSRRNRLYLE